MIYFLSINFLQLFSFLLSAPISFLSVTVSEQFPYVSADGLRELLQKLQEYKNLKEFQLPDNFPPQFREATANSLREMERDLQMRSAEFSGGYSQYIQMLEEAPTTMQKEFEKGEGEVVVLEKGLLRRHQKIRNDCIELFDRWEKLKVETLDRAKLRENRARNLADVWESHLHLFRDMQTECKACDPSLLGDTSVADKLLRSLEQSIDDCQKEMVTGKGDYDWNFLFEDTCATFLLNIQSRVGVSVFNGGGSSAADAGGDVGGGSSAVDAGGGVGGGSSAVDAGGGVVNAVIPEDGTEDDQAMGAGGGVGGTDEGLPPIIEKGEKMCWHLRLYACLLVTVLFSHSGWQVLATISRRCSASRLAVLPLPSGRNEFRRNRHRYSTVPKVGQI